MTSHNAGSVTITVRSVILQKRLYAIVAASKHNTHMSSFPVQVISATRGTKETNSLIGMDGSLDYEKCRATTLAANSNGISNMFTIIFFIIVQQHNDLRCHK